jgi:hypothetical protein
MAAATAAVKEAVAGIVGGEISAPATATKDPASGQTIDFVFKKLNAAGEVDGEIATMIVGPYTNQTMYPNRCADWVMKAYGFAMLYDLVILALPDRESLDAYRSRIEHIRRRAEERNKQSGSPVTPSKPFVEVVFVEVPPLSDEENEALASLAR